MRCFIDTNIFLRVLVKEDPATFQECYKLLQAVQERRIKAFTSSLVLAEIAWVLSTVYALSKKDVVEAIRYTLNLKGLSINDHSNANLAVEMFRTTSVKFIDALIASHRMIQNKQAIIISYDKDFDRLGTQRKEPKDLRF